MSVNPIEHQKQTLLDKTEKLRQTPNQPSGYGMGGYNPYSEQVKAFQHAWNVANPQDAIAEDGIRGQQTSSRMDKVGYAIQQPEGEQPGGLDMEEAQAVKPLSPSEYADKFGINPMAQYIDALKPKPEDNERRKRAMKYQALGMALRNVVDAVGGSNGAAISRHEEPNWMMSSLKAYRDNINRDKAEEYRYNMLQLQHKMREHERFNQYLNNIDERNYRIGEANRQQRNNLRLREQASKDAYALAEMKRKDALDKEERDWQRKMKEYQLKKAAALEVAKVRGAAKGAASGETSGNGSDLGKPAMIASNDGQALPLWQGDISNIVEFARTNPINEADRKRIDDIKFDLTGQATKAQREDIVQRYLPAYLKAQGKLIWLGAQPTSQGAPAAAVREQAAQAKPAAAATQAQSSQTPAQPGQQPLDTRTTTTSPGTPGTIAREPVSPAQSAGITYDSFKASPAIQELIRQYGEAAVRQAFEEQYTQQ